MLGIKFYLCIFWKIFSGIIFYKERIFIFDIEVDGLFLLWFVCLWKDIVLVFFNFEVWKSYSVIWKNVIIKIKMIIVYFILLKMSLILEEVVCINCKY